jgi:hypothetical protein
MVPLLVPLAVVPVIHDVLSEVVHAQPAPAVIAKLSEPAAAPMLSEVGENAYVHAATPVCCTECVAVPVKKPFGRVTVIEPLRVEPVPLAATLKLMVCGPVPLAGTPVIHDVDVAVHEVVLQPRLEPGEYVALPLPAALPNVDEVGVK